MEEYRVKKINEIKQTSITVNVPGSKSITNRALLLAALAKGESALSGVLFSDDSRHFLDCVQKLGIETKVEEDNCNVTVNGHGGQVPAKDAAIYVGSAGTAARFLAAFLGLSEGTHYMDASAQMRKRPMGPLLKTLTGIGASFLFEGQDGHFPFAVTGAGLLIDASDNEKKRIDVSVNINDSSQFLSALLISLGAYPGESVIRVEGTHGMAYIDMTVRMMEQFGIKVQSENGVYKIAKQGGYQAKKYDIEPDVSAACYFYAMAALLGISITVSGVHEESLQGDVEFVHILEKMGCICEDTPEGICVSKPVNGILKGVDVNMHSCSDQAITLAAIAPFADTPTTIRGIAHIRLQESNRIAAICTELTRMGIRCEEGEDSITIWPGTPKPALIQTYDDHRMAMGFSLVGLRAEGIVINDPMCCKKTFEHYFDVLDESVFKASNDIKNMTDHIDLLINCAGILGDMNKNLGDDLDFDEIMRVINVNAIGTLRITNALFSLVLNSSKKTIVNISSEAGSIADCWRTGWFGYCMSKAANNMQSALVHTDLTQRQATVVPLTEF